MVLEGKSGLKGEKAVRERDECLLCRWRAMSNESPMKVSSCCVEEEELVVE